VKQRLPGCKVSYGDYYIKRDYIETPQLYDQYGRWMIPYDSEDLMLLLRLFKPGNINFVEQVFHTPDGTWYQRPYPQVFSELHSSPRYTLRMEECASFDTFFANTPTWPGWKSAWFKVSRRYFLWGSSKEFNIARERSENWELERILDFYTALEAALVPEDDGFVARRLRERAAKLLQLSTDAAKTLKKRFTELYRVRSSVAHGGIREHSEEEKNRKKNMLSNLMPAFEQDVRDLLKAALQYCPCDENNRLQWLKKSLYDISDQDKADRLEQNFKAIQDINIRNRLLVKLQSI